MSKILMFILVVFAIQLVIMSVVSWTAKNSIVFTVSLSSVLFAGTTSILGYLTSTYGYTIGIWVIPLTLLISVLIIRYLRRNLLSPINELTNKIGTDFTQGDLTFEFNEQTLNRKDEIGTIALNVNNLKQTLNTIVNNIKNISADLNISAQQQNNVAVDLAQGASEQAANTEEVSSSMEEMASINHQNMDNTVKTEQITL